MAETSRRWVPLTYTTIKVRCPECGVEAYEPVHKIRLWRCTTPGGRDFYAWVCTPCGQPVTKPSDVYVGSLLTAGGVPSVLFALPDEAADRARLSSAWGPYDAADLSLDIAALPEIEEAS